MNLYQHTFENGLTLLGEPMDWLQSVAFSINLPAGCGSDPADRLGLANFTAEMVQRGAGDLDSRMFVEALDRLGADRSGHVSGPHTSFAVSTISENLVPALKIYADLVRRPHIPVEQLEDARDVCFLELHALEDDLAQRTLLELKQLTYGSPWGRPSVGTVDDVAAVSVDDIRAFHRQNYVPTETIISVAGRFDWHELLDATTQLFSEWKAPAPPELERSDHDVAYRHINCPSSQTQIGLAYPVVPYKHKDYFLSRGAVGILSDGMSSRLFTEVRENRGLCYTVYASYHSLREEGRVLCYAGTSTERAQETLDVIVAELDRLRKGIDDCELKRLKARTKSALIMQQESSTTRCGAIAGDWYYLGRVRSMEEVNSAIDGLSREGINQFLADNPPGQFYVVTLGEQPLEMPYGIS